MEELAGRQSHFASNSTLRTTAVRSAGIDAARLIGIVAITLGRAVPTEAVRPWTFTWPVAPLSFLSGYLWMDARQLREQIQRRWSSILKP